MTFVETRIRSARRSKILVSLFSGQLSGLRAGPLCHAPLDAASWALLAMANFFNQPGCGSCGGRGGCGSFGLQYGFSAMNVPTYGPPDRREHPAESALQSFAWNQSLHPPGIGMSPDEHGGMVFAFLSCKLG